MKRLETKSFTVSWETGSPGENNLDSCATRGMYFRADAIKEMQALHKMGRPATVVEITPLTELIRKHRPDGQWREVEQTGGAKW